MEYPGYHKKTSMVGGKMAEAMGGGKSMRKGRKHRRTARKGGKSCKMGVMMKAKKGGMSCKMAKKGGMSCKMGGMMKAKKGGLRGYYLGGMKKSKKGGMSCKTGGRKTRKTRKVHRRVKKGGAMMRGLEGMVKTALVPFGLFAAQKHVQRRRK